MVRHVSGTECRHSRDRLSIISESLSDTPASLSGTFPIRGSCAVLKVCSTMEPAERQVELAALMTFNGNDPMNALNDLASSAATNSYSESWTPDSALRSSRPKTTNLTNEPPKESEGEEARAMYLLRLEEPFDTPLKLQQLARLLTLPAIQGNEDDPIVFCTVNGTEKQQIEAAVAAEGLSNDLFFMEYTPTKHKSDARPARSPARS